MSNWIRGKLTKDDVIIYVALILLVSLTVWNIWGIIKLEHIHNKNKEEIAIQQKILEFYERNK